MASILMLRGPLSTSPTINNLLLTETMHVGKKVLCILLHCVH